uniref:tRNA methyltransferase activator subunit 11-2 n=1 Tax=Aquila chrysaetos chrysaetos TaxID=223781 RepID=A0A663EHZ8_AQUCH
MKLLTHNLLSSHVRGLRPGGGFPLQIQASEVRVRPVPFNAAFVARLVPRLRWAALLEAAESLGHPSELPPEPAADYEGDESFLRRVHHILLEVRGGPQNPGGSPKLRGPPSDPPPCRPPPGGGAGGGPAVPGLGASLPHFQGDPQHVAERGGGLRGGGGRLGTPNLFGGSPCQKKKWGGSPGAG